ncbi:hypothetical protein HWV62_5028 [Athelia sp. TMB]|nr:hypothetical protein HWV62_5028 [Athelia sp. TMB]
MRPPRSVLLCALFITAVRALLVPENDRTIGLNNVLARNGDHHHQGTVLLALNETDVLMGHGPTPPSYWTIDVVEGSGHAGLMVLHVIFMCAAFFVALPAAIALRSVKHVWHSVAVCAFYILCIIGCSTSSLYTKITPQMYEDQKHSRHGYFIFLVAICVSVIDCMAVVGRIMGYFRTADRRKFTFRDFWRYVILNRESVASGSLAEYIGLVPGPEEYGYTEMAMEAIGHDEEPAHARRNQPALQQRQLYTDRDNTQRSIHWENDVHDHDHARSTIPERTSVDILSPRKHHSNAASDDIDYIPSGPKALLLHHIGRVAIGAIERGLVIGGFVQLLSGVVVYTGGCRGNYFNGCLAHLVKGGIFWCYGLLTFARFLGSFADLGWAWNRPPRSGYVSAEFVESFLIFTYGITNTWMERWGAHPGDPFTTKQLQHISIAVMFWFAGLIGMGIELKRVREWLAESAMPAQGGSQSAEAIVEPPSYAASFNPFPALVIGVTGAAMSAHAQAYVFQDSRFCDA